MTRFLFRSSKRFRNILSKRRFKIVYRCDKYLQIIWQIFSQPLCVILNFLNYTSWYTIYTQVHNFKFIIFILLLLYSMFISKKGKDKIKKKGRRGGIGFVFTPFPARKEGGGSVRVLAQHNSSKVWRSALFPSQFFS